MHTYSRTESGAMHQYTKNASINVSLRKIFECHFQESDVTLFEFNVRDIYVSGPVSAAFVRPSSLRLRINCTSIIESNSSSPMN